jgi:hypothetical protein
MRRIIDAVSFTALFPLVAWETNLKPGIKHKPTVKFM